MFPRPSLSALPSVLAAALLAAGCSRMPAEQAISEGQKALAAGDWATAADRLERAADARSDSPELHYNLGMARLMAGDAEGAKEAFSDAVRLDRDSDDTRALEGLAEACRRLGDTAGAVAAYNGALGKSYKPYLKACLAGCEMDRNRMGAAAAYLEDALAKDPDEPVALFNDAVLHAREPVPNPVKAHTRAANGFMRFLLSPRSEPYPEQRADAVRRLAALSRARPPELQRQIDDLLEESHAAQTPRYAADCASKAFLLDPSFSDSLAWYATCIGRQGPGKAADEAKLRQVGHRLFPSDRRFLTETR